MKMNTINTTTSIKTLFVVLLALLVFSSCKKDEDTPTPEDGNGGPNVDVKNLDASDGYVFYSLTTGTEVSKTDSNSTQWDIAFNATTIIINGGESGPGAGGALLLNKLYDEVTEAPKSGYDGSQVPKNTYPDRWYSYNLGGNHLIKPIPGKIIVVRTADGRYAKIEIISYYQDIPDLTGKASSDVEPRFYSFNFEIIPVEADVEDLDASTGVNTFLSLSTESTVATADSNSTQWDLGFNGSKIIVNGGATGPGSVEVQWVDGTYDDIQNAPFTGYSTTVDSWYDYDPATHIITPKIGKVLIIKDTNGDYYKLQIVSYYKGNPELEGKSYTELSSKHYTIILEEIAAPAV